MGLFHTADGKHYRRWVSVVLTWPLPGAAQFLAGRRLRGWFCLVGFNAWLIVWFAVLFHPAVPWSMVDPGLWLILPLGLWLAIAVDAARHPFPRISKKRWFASLAGFLALVACTVALPALAFRGFISSPFRNIGSSMAPTLLGDQVDDEGEEIPGDHLWVNRLAYRLQGPQRGDIVAFKTTGIPLLPQGLVYVKRVVGLPGETVGIESPHLVVNGERVREPRVFREMGARENGYSGYATTGQHKDQTFCLASSMDRLTLGEDEYLLLGDNSENSFDGRFYGSVKRQSIIGKVEAIYAPADRKRLLKRRRNVKPQRTH